jgi:CheY-like chemotaxis protein
VAVYAIPIGSNRFRMSGGISDNCRQKNEETPEPPTAARGLRILVVDDDECYNTCISEMIIEMGHAVAGVAYNGIEAIEIYSRNSKDIDVVLMDVMMPGKNGILAADDIRRIDPAVKIVLMSGYPENKNLISHLERVSFLAKPFRREEILPVL